jgi:hypothetical protein
MRKNTLQTFLAVLGAINVAGPLILDAISVLPNWPWQIHAFIGFVVFSGIITWILVEKQNEINALLDTKPDIIVTVEKANDMYYLKVHNKGEEGTFQAQIKLTSTDHSVACLPEYYSYWKLNNGKESKILKGHEDFIIIAEEKSSPPDFRIVYLKILFYDASTKSMNYVNTSSYYVGGYITDKDGKFKHYMEKPEYNLMVTINATQGLKSGVFQKNFILKVGEFTPKEN